MFFWADRKTGELPCMLFKWRAAVACHPYCIGTSFVNPLVTRYHPPASSASASLTAAAPPASHSIPARSGLCRTSVTHSVASCSVHFPTAICCNGSAPVFFRCSFCLFKSVSPPRVQYKEGVLGCGGGVPPTPGLEVVVRSTPPPLTCQGGSGPIPRGATQDPPKRSKLSFRCFAPVFFFVFAPAPLLILCKIWLTAVGTVVCFPAPKTKTSTFKI